MLGGWIPLSLPVCIRNGRYIFISPTFDGKSPTIDISSETEGGERGSTIALVL